MFIGTLVHELLQESLKAKVHSVQGVRTVLEEVLSRKAIRQDLLILEMTESDLRMEVEPFLPHIEFFAKRYEI